jgi:Spy/CpxP family protein refolding chaperone
MNNRVLLASVTAVCGFALGWAIKPAPKSETSGTESQVDAASHQSGRIPEQELHTTNRAHEPGVAPPVDDSPPDETQEDPKAFAARMERAFKNATFQRDRGKLLRLAEALGLTNEQITQLEALLAQQRRTASPLGAPNANRNPKETLDTLILSAKEADDQFRATLTPEQNKALEALRARQRENQTETRAQKELSELTSRLDLTPGQRESALQVLRAQAAKIQAKFPEGSDLISESSLLPLVGAGQYSANSVEAMALLATDPPASNDPRASMEKMSEIQLKQMHERLAGLSTILTPAQLDQYRVAMEASSLSKSRQRAKAE